MSFLKRLFGRQTEPSRPAAEVSAAVDVISQCRAHVATIDRRRQPQQWAEAMQILGHNLISVSQGDTAISGYTEAAHVLAEALDAAGQDGNPLFRASIAKLRGEAFYRHAELLVGDPRGFMMADSANALADALALVQPHQSRALWTEAALFRGAALHELGRLKSGPEGLAWMDEAAACFAEIAEHGSDNGVHPFGLYNRYAVLEQRGHRTSGAGRAMYYAEARSALVEAMKTETFADKPDLAVKLAELDAWIEASA